MSRKHPKRSERSGVDRYGRTPLHQAAFDGNLIELTRLLGAGADPNAADDNGWTPLHAAAQGWHPHLIEALVIAGARVNAQDAHGNTPLSTAVFNSRGRGEVIQVLRQHGADATLVNHHGISPLGLAKTIANFDVTQYFPELP